MRVHIVCQNHTQDRIIPRMARALSNLLGWTLGTGIDPRAEAVYLSAYFEGKRVKTWPSVPVGAYFTHIEEEPPGNSKAAYFKHMAKRVDLRVATCRLYGDLLAQAGPTVVAAAPLERDRFVIGKAQKHTRPVVGVSGYTYKNHRKGEHLIAQLIGMPVAHRVEWRASGRGWPVKTTSHSWAKMPAFYQGLDVLVCPSLVEGIPMPPLEALACGCKIVIPRGVGMLDDLPAIPGIHRYKRGDVKSMAAALEEAIETKADRRKLRAATKPYSVEQWCYDLRDAFAATFAGEVKVLEPVEPAEPEPEVQAPASARGIYCVAFGDPARGCALRMMQTAKKHMPDVPICLCSDRKIGPEDVLVRQKDSDVGGRRAKLRAYELSPKGWESILYLDADTEVVAPIYRYFEWLEAGWEFIITKDPHFMDTMHTYRRRGNEVELQEIEKRLYTLHTLQYNGGVWAFRRCDRVAAFFKRWLAEWERHAARDQGPLIRAMYTDPLRVLLLGNEWNTFDKYTKGIQTAGLLHFPGRARRWKGPIPGRIDGDAAWAKVRDFDKKHGKRRGKR